MTLKIFYSDSFQDELQLQLKLFQLYHNKQELVEKREISDKKKDEVTKLEKRKEISDEDIKAKKKELAIYNKELANDEQKVKELVRLIVKDFSKENELFI
jgi:hypothetical protein